MLLPSALVLLLTQENRSRSKSRDYCDKEEDIKALSIVRPSGSRIASGEKTLEVRRWKPNLARSEDLLIVENGRFLHDDGDHDENGTPVAIVKVKTVRPFTLADHGNSLRLLFRGRVVRVGVNRCAPDTLR